MPMPIEIPPKTSANPPSTSPAGAPRIVPVAKRAAMPRPPAIVPVSPWKNCSTESLEKPSVNQR